MRFLTILFLSMFIFTACSDDDSSPTNPTTGITEYDFNYPLAVGNSWVMHKQYFDEDGTLGSERTDTTTIQSVRDFTINNEKIKLYITRDDSYSSRAYFIYNGIFNDGKVKKDPSPESLEIYPLFKIHVKLNDTINIAMEDNSKRWVEVAKIATPLKCANKTYSCTKLLLHTDPVSSTRYELYIADKIGIVSQKIYKKNETTGKEYLRSSMDLINYSVK